MIIFFQKNRSANLSLQAILQRVYGVGRYSAIFVVKLFGFRYNVLFKHIKIKSLKKIENYIEDNFIIGVDLKRRKKAVVDVLRKQNLYRGRRHRQFLPVHFQRTHSNANSVRYKYQPRKRNKRGKKYLRVKKSKNI